MSTLASEHKEAASPLIILSLLANIFPQPTTSTLPSATEPIQLQTCCPKHPLLCFSLLPALQRPIRMRRVLTHGLYRNSMALAQQQHAGHGALASRVQLVLPASPLSRQVTATSTAGLMSTSNARKWRSTYLAKWLFRSMARTSTVVC